LGGSVCRRWFSILRAEGDDRDCFHLDGGEEPFAKEEGKDHEEAEHQPQWKEEGEVALGLCCGGTPSVLSLERL